MALLDSRVVFNLGAWAYDQLTRQTYWREQVRALLVFLPAPAPRDRGLRVLDLGCGPGVSSFALAEALPAEALVVGVDLAARAVARAARYQREEFSHLGQTRFAVADATALPFADGAFDFVIGHSFLYLVPDRRAVLAEVRRVLRPGGVVALMEPRVSGSLVTAARTAWPRRGELLRAPIPVLRFVASMVAWRMFSSMKGRLSERSAVALLVEAGLGEPRVVTTLGGLGLHCVAQR